MLHVKSKRELEVMRKAGKLVASVLQQLRAMAEPGVRLIDLDREAEKMTLSFGAKPAFKGYMGYKHCLCTSVNEQVVHGIPSERKLLDGDIVGLDFGLVFEGFFGDSAITVPIGKVKPAGLQLARATVDSLYAAIAACRAGNSLKDLAGAVEDTIKPYGYGIVREFVGHGIGQRLHEDPQVPNYRDGASNLKLKPGMTIAIEPMINEGKAEVKVLEDRWTAVTVDGKLSAHFEHSIAITDGEPEILTEWDNGSFRGVVR